MLADGTVEAVRDLTGYDRVMVYRFDPDGHGKVIAEARHPRLESLLGHHYPATDIPQRARELYLRNRVRVLVDVQLRRRRRWCRAGCPVDRRPNSTCRCAYLRSMSPLHLQYLKNMGVTGDAGGLAGARRPAVGADRLPSLRAAQPALRGAHRRRTARRGGRHAHRRDRELRARPGGDPGAAARAAADRGHLDRGRLAARAAAPPADAAAAAGGHRRGAVPRRRDP
ncbi:MAG: GAF domain-containing protein [Comamonadaceae bacterium]|nr:GAF domain-containing protein [Comamonadaceae bacterium]